MVDCSSISLSSREPVQKHHKQLRLLSILNKKWIQYVVLHSNYLIRSPFCGKTSDLIQKFANEMVLYLHAVTQLTDDSIMLASSISLAVKF